MGEFFDMQEDGILDENGEYVEYEYGNCFTQYKEKQPKKNKPRVSKPRVSKPFVCNTKGPGKFCNKRFTTREGLDRHREVKHISKDSG